MRCGSSGPTTTSTGWCSPIRLSATRGFPGRTPRCCAGLANDPGWQMTRVMAAIWLAVVVLLGTHLAWRVHQGLTFRTDLMALLPRDEADPALQRVNDDVALSLSRRVAILVGNPDRT